jgi:hypothetical protein
VIILLPLLGVALRVAFYEIFSMHMYSPQVTIITGEVVPFVANTFIQDWGRCCEPQNLYFLLYGVFAVILRYQPRFIATVLLVTALKFMLSWEDGPGHFSPDGRWHYLWPTPFYRYARICFRNHIHTDYLPPIIFIAFSLNYFFDCQRYKPIELLASFSLVMARVVLWFGDDYIVHKTNYTFLWEVFKDKFFWAILLTIILWVSVAPLSGTAIFFTVVYFIHFFYVLVIILILFCCFFLYTLLLIAVFQLAEDFE